MRNLSSSRFYAIHYDDSARAGRPDAKGQVLARQGDLPAATGPEPS